MPDAFATFEDDGDEWELDEFDEPGQVRVVNAAIGTFLSTLVGQFE